MKKFAVTITTPMFLALFTAAWLLPQYGWLHNVAYGFAVLLAVIFIISAIIMFVALVAIGNTDSPNKLIESWTPEQTQKILNTPVWRKLWGYFLNLYLVFIMFANGFIVSGVISIVGLFITKIVARAIATAVEKIRKEQQEDIDFRTRLAKLAKRP